MTIGILMTFLGAVLVAYAAGVRDDDFSPIVRQLFASIGILLLVLA